MNRRTIHDYLTLAERHVTLSQADVERYRRLLAELERDGKPVHQARAHLESVVHLLHQHEAERDRLQDELAALGPGPESAATYSRLPRL